MSEVKKLHILNLIGDLQDSMNDCLKLLDASVYTREKCEDFKIINTVFVNSSEQAEQIEQELDSTKNNIAVICFSKVEDMKNFLLNNGRLVINPEFANSELGINIIKKFFDKSFSIHLSDNYSQLEGSIESLKLLNHLSVGEDLDCISLDSFEKGFNIISIRSFLDHSIFYFTYLKQAGLAGVPFDIEYGSTDSHYFVSIHASVKNFVAEYLVEAFGQMNAHRPFNYLLGVVASSCDFLEVTYVQEPGKVVISGIWNDVEKSSLNGVMFNNIKTTSQTLGQLNSKIKDYKQVDEQKSALDENRSKMFPAKLPGGIIEMMMGENPESILYKNPEDTSKLIAVTLAKIEEYCPVKGVEELDRDKLTEILGKEAEEELVNKLGPDDLDFLLERIKNNKIENSYYDEMERVRSELKDDDNFKKTLGDTLSQEVAKKVSGQLDADTLNRILNGDPDGKELATLVKGSKDEADNFVQKIKSTKADKDRPFVQTISNAFKKDTGKFIVKINNSSSDEGKKGLLNYVSNVMTNIDSVKDMSPSIKNFIKKNAPSLIEKKLKKFAEKAGVGLAEITEEMISEFNETAISETLQEVMADDNLIEEFKKDLEDKASFADSDSNNEFEGKLRENLRKSLDVVEGVKKEDNQYNFTNEDIQKVDIQSVITQTLEDTIKEKHHIKDGSKEAIAVKEQEIIDDLSFSLKKEKNDVVTIVKEAAEKVKAKEVETVVDNLFRESLEETVVKSSETSSSQTFEMNELIRKLKIAEEENKELEKRLKVFNVKAQSVQVTDQMINKIKDDLKQSAENEVKKQDEDNPKDEMVIVKAEEVQATILKAQNGQLTEEEQKILLEKVKAEQALLEQAQVNDVQLRKLKIEAQQMEGVYKSELGKTQLALKSKSMLVDQLKANTKSLMEKKQAEVIGLNNKLKNLNNRLSDDSLVQLKKDLSTVTQNAKSLEKMNQIYKGKLEALSKSNKANKKNVDTTKLNEQIRSLTTTKNQLENKFNAEMKKASSYMERYEKSRELEARYRTQLTASEGLIKDYELQVKKLKDSHGHLSKMLELGKNDGKPSDEVKKIEDENKVMQTKVMELTAKVLELEKNAKDDSKTVADPVAVDSKTKNLEQGNKKLQQELAKAQGALSEQKKDFMKQKSENTALKNQIQALKKDLAKLQAETKKKGGKKAA